MVAREKILISWSGGKDSALALYEILNDGCFEPSSLLTILNQDYRRISMHGVREKLLEQQGNSLGISLEKVYISKNASNYEYETEMKKILQSHICTGINAVCFGDIHLEDVRKYRELNLSRVGMRAIFPLWKKSSSDLANKFIDLGFKAIITCVDSKTLDPKFVGRIFDSEFLSELPPDVDPIGENGEFHSFVYDGPIFKERILFNTGEMVKKNDRFHYLDLLPG